MKRRVEKKLYNRFIKPIIKNLPTTDSMIIEEDRIIGNNHTIINGEVVSEGMRFKPSNDYVANFRKTAETAKKIIQSHEKVYFRIFGTRSNQVRLRLITE